MTFRVDGGRQRWIAPALLVTAILTVVLATLGNVLGRGGRSALIFTEGPWWHGAILWAGALVWILGLPWSFGGAWQYSVLVEQARVGARQGPWRRRRWYAVAQIRGSRRGPDERWTTLYFTDRRSVTVSGDARNYDRLRAWLEEREIWATVTEEDPDFPPPGFPYR